jgi:uncharacterized lipoprotein YbaY
LIRFCGSHAHEQKLLQFVIAFNNNKIKEEDKQKNNDISTEKINKND